jgi:hypothetical protein
MCVLGCWCEDGIVEVGERWCLVCELIRMYTFFFARAFREIFSSIQGEGFDDIWEILGHPALAGLASPDRHLPGRSLIHGS